MTSAEDKARRGLVRLLQFLLPGPATRLTTAPAGQGTAGVLLLSARGREQAFPVALLEICARQGLIRMEHERCHSLPPARALLKRLIAGAEFGFAAQHGAIETEERVIGTDRLPVRVNRDTTPLTALARLKERDGSGYFPEEALKAGERLASDFTFGGLQPRVTASWEPRLEANRQAGQGGAATLSDSTADARGRVARAATALGPELSGVVLDVCCFAKGLELVERERQWPPRSAKLMLRTALMALARHYGYLKS